MPGPYQIIDPSNPVQAYSGVPNAGQFGYGSNNQFVFSAGGALYAAIFDYFGDFPVGGYDRGLYVYKSSDSGATWAICDFAGTPNATSDWTQIPLHPYGAGTIGSTLYLVHQALIADPYGATPYGLALFAFNLSTESFSGSQNIDDSQVASVEGGGNHCVVSRDDGTVIVLHNGPPSGGYARLHYTTWNGSSWGAQTLLASNAGENCYPATAIQGANGVTHVFYVRSADTPQLFTSGVSLYHVGIDASMTAGTHQLVMSGLNWAYPRFHIEMASRPRIEGGTIYLAVQTHDSAFTSYPTKAYLVTGDDSQEPTFASELAISASWLDASQKGFYMNRQTVPGCGVAVLAPGQNDVLAATSYAGGDAQWRERPYYYPYTATGTEIVWVADGVGLASGKTRLCSTTKSGESWSSAQDFLLLDRETQDQLQSVCSIKLAACCDEPCAMVF